MQQEADRNSFKKPRMTVRFWRTFLRKDYVSKRILLSRSEGLGEDWTSTESKMLTEVVRMCSSRMQSPTKRIMIVS